MCGVVCICIALYLQIAFPFFKPVNTQHKNIVIRKKYILYYILIFLSGARRQIFIVFAAFLMVEKFKYSASQVTLLFLLALIMIQDADMRTAPLALSYFAGNKRYGDPAITAAAAIWVALPVLIIYGFFIVTVMCAKHMYIDL